MEVTTLPAKVDLTPQVLAQAFWALDDRQQAEFFAELAKQDKAYTLELQWYFLGKRLEEDDMRPARDALMSLAAPLYLHTLAFREAA